MDKILQNSFKKNIENFLEKMGFSKSTFDIEIIENAEEARIFNIKTEGDSKFLIGQHGDNLSALQHIFRLIMRKQFPDNREGFFLDVNGYREEKKQSLIELAKNAAKEVLHDKKTLVLREMTPYERRIIHMALADNKDVLTESTGEGVARKIIIKLVDIVE